MPDNVETLMFEILKNIQTELSTFRSETNERLDRLETTVRKQRRDIAGILVIMKATAGDFDERVTELEERMAALESRAS